MHRNNPTILVSGAGGRFASLVIPQLVNRQVSVRAFIKDPAKADCVRSLGASEIAFGDLRDCDSIDRALSGVDGVFYIGPAFAPDEETMGVAMVEAAARANVRKFVFSSVMQPTNVRLKNHASKIPVEDALYSTRMEYTVLHPANFMQNIAGVWPSIIARGVFSEPFPASVRISRVDYRDVAEVAAIALTTDELAYATLELCASDRLTRLQIAEIMSQELGRTVSAGEPGFAEWAATANLPYNEEQMSLLAKVHEHYTNYGLGGNGLTLKAVLSREPRSLRGFVRELVQSTALAH